jgi:fructokinase
MSKGNRMPSVVETVIQDATQPLAALEPARNILLFGELLMDRFPERDIPGGAPFNVASHLRRLGRAAAINPMLVTRIGKDEDGRKLQDAMHEAGLPIDGVQHDCLHPTGVVQVVADPIQGHRFEIAPDQAWDHIHADTARLVGLLVRPAWLYFGTLAQRANSATALKLLLQTTQASGFLDLNLRDPWLDQDSLRWSLAHAVIAKMNLEELHRVATMMELGSARDSVLGMRLLHAFGIRHLLVTEGSAGAWLLQSDGSLLHTEAGPALSGVIDSVGAGDGFAAVFLLGATLGWPMNLTLARAHRFAGEICRIRGAIPDSDAFYRRFIDAWQLGAEAAA